MVNPLKRKLMRVSKPSRYIGGEYGAVCKPWNNAELRWCLAFPEVYEIGMSHLGLNLIYYILNEKEGVLADRVYAPWPDMENLLINEKQNLWGLETGKRLNQFDAIGITIPYELTYTNIISVLKLGGINPLASERSENDPLIIGGGSGAFNPEPVAAFFDAILIGDGEEAINEISRILKESKANSISKKETFKSLRKISGVYIPSIGTEENVMRATVSDLNNVYLPDSFMVPNVQLVHDRVGVEIQRGCSRGCRFCQAGMIYRPDRARKAAEIINYLDKTVKKSGYEECGLLSLSTGDYNGIADVICDLDKKFKNEWVHVSLPSLRSESLSDAVVGSLSRSLKGGFTLAPEAATERLRKVINKGNTEKEFIDSVERVFKTGWKNLKLYFMIGLPTESEEDIKAIPTLAKKVQQIGRKYHKFPNITVNVSTFVPKPHTPFQWERQLTSDETCEIHNYLRRTVKGPGLKLKLHKPEISFLEGIFSRGGRELSKALLTAYERGCRFDAWDDQLKFDIWLEILKDSGIDAGNYLSERNESEKLPWDHLFADLNKEFLKRERRKAIEGEPTPDCSGKICAGCGICDFEDVRPITNVIARSEVAKQSPANDKRLLRPKGLAMTVGHELNNRCYSLNFSKTGDAVYIGHIDLMNIFRRAFRRAGLPLNYSDGFNPRPKISFQNALPVGIESLDEWCKVELREEWEPEQILDALRGAFPEGINIIASAKITGDLPRSGASIYSISILDSAALHLNNKLEEFYAAQEIFVTKTTKKGIRELNLKDSVVRLAQTGDNVIKVEFKQEGGKASIIDFAKWFAEGLDTIKITKEKSCLTN